ncbi:MAG: molybdenum cofactor biosynthesis protein A [Candidatus Methanolliviera sp. GoM_asphalt]|nr:MAG: molybdenum cofactor biosynthesis protein A [Candidatus Methanolliviera sp. GoM_asphalt]
MKISSIFGPVPSRRLGLSLGVDIVPYKTCCFDCIYCQLGRTTDKTVQRREYIRKEKIIKDLRDFLDDPPPFDYITFSGSGEPTLNDNIGKLIEEAKKISDVPVVVLTNGALLFDEDLQKELMPADIIIPSMDAVTEDVFNAIDRPHPSLNIEKIIDGLTSFTRRYSGEIWLEIMLVKGVNDRPEDIDAMKRVLETIDAEKIQLNTPIRPPIEDIAKTVDWEKMNDVAKYLGAEVITEFEDDRIKLVGKETEGNILNLLRRRPCTTDEISGALSMEINEVIKYLNLLKDKKIKVRVFQDKNYWVMK